MDSIYTSMRIIRDPGFVLRDAEMSFLKQKLAGVHDGTGSTIFVAGESGVGKTRLVDEFLSHAAQHNCQCLRAQCLPEHVMPFAPIIAMLTEANLEHLILEDKPPKLEAVYAVTKGGIVGAKYERKESIDTDIFMGMLTAVKTFITDSLSQIKQGKVKEDVQVLVHGTFSIVNVPGRALNLVALTTGRENEYLLEDLRAIIQKFENEHGIDAHWQEDEAKVRAIETEITEIFNAGRYEGVDYSDDPKIRQGNILENVLRAIQRKSEIQPVILFIDDLQWADSASLALLHYLARNTKKNRVMILGTYRTEELEKSNLQSAIQIMDREGVLEKIELRRFDMQECARLIDATLDASIDQEFVEEIYKRTAGNALFVLEMLKQMEAEGFLKQENGRWAYHFDKVFIPTRVYDVILRRIQRIPEEAREILDAGSVIGDVFSSDVLEKISGIQHLHLLRLLAKIEREHHLIISIKGGYKFEHPKIREVIYSQLPDELRVAYHEMVAKLLEEKYKQGNRECLADIVHHCASAGVRDKVIEYGLTAGILARKRYANDEALSIYKTVLDSLDENNFEMKRQVWNEIADILDILGRYDEAIAYLKKVIETGGAGERATGHRKIAMMHIKKGDYTQAMDEVRAGLELADEESAERARLFSIEGIIYEKKGAYDQAITMQQRALHGLNDKKDIANVLNRTGANFWYKGDYSKALEYFGRSIEIREEIGDLYGLSSSYSNIAAVYNEIGEYEKATEYLEKSIELRKKIKDIQGIAVSYNNLGVFYDDRGMYDRALDYFHQSLQLRERIGDLYGIALCSLNIGMLFHVKGDFKSALEFYMKGLEIHSKIGSRRGAGIAHLNIGKLYCDMGEYKEAIGHLQEAQSTGTQTGDGYLELMAHACLSETLAGLGERELAIQHINTAMQILEMHHLEASGRELYLTVGRVFSAIGEPVKAVEYYQKTCSICEKTGKKGMTYYLALSEIGKFKRDVELIKEALRWFESIGNKSMVERAKSDLEKYAKAR